MSAPDLSIPASASMTLGDSSSPDAFVVEEAMVEVAEPAVAAPEEAPVKKPRKTPVKKTKAVVPVTETDENGEATGNVENETPAKPKKVRKTPVKKDKAAVETGENEEAASGDAEAEALVKATPKKRGPNKKKENVKPKEEVAAKEGDDYEVLEEPTTPKAVPKKRGPNKKKADATPATPATPAGDEDGNADMSAEGATKTPATKPSSKKRGPANSTDNETPTKKSKAANGSPTAGKRAGNSFPECWAEFSEEDKLIVNMKRKGEKIGPIEVAWTALMGRAPGKDVLRKRIPKLEAVAQDFNDADIARLVAAKKVVDAEFVTIKENMAAEQAAALKKIKTDQDNALKKQETEKWAKIAEHVSTAGGEGYKAFLIEKKWKALERDGTVDANGNLKGLALVEADEEAADEDMENADVDDEESSATNGNGNLKKEEVDAEAMEE